MSDRTYSRAAYRSAPHLDSGLRSRVEGATMPITGKDHGSDAKHVQTHPPGPLRVLGLTAPGDTAHLKPRKELYHATT